MKSVSRATAALLLYLVVSTAMPAEVVRTVPEKFIGDWCTTPKSDHEGTGESDITIGKNEIDYYMSSGKILAAAAVENQLALLVELDMGGDVRVATHLYDISHDGSRIDEEMEDGTIRTREKCMR